MQGREHMLAGAQIVRLVERIRVRMGFPAEVFELAVRPVIEACARRAGPAGTPARAKLEHRLQRASRALQIRQGRILPRGVAPEEIAAQAHRWSYAILLAALLPRVRPGEPAAGAGDAAPLLLEAVVPAPVMAWLGAEREPLGELRAWLSGEAGRAGVIAQILGAADAHGAGTIPAPGPLVVVDGRAGDLATPPEEAHPGEPAGERASAPAQPVAAPAQAGAVDVPVRADAPDAFLQWVREAIAGGSLPVNRPGGLVHVVPEGLLLVSPAIFLRHAQAIGKPKEAARIQRQVLRQGWHLKDAAGVNMIAYQVVGAAGRGARICGVVLHDPRRVIDAPPGLNAGLIRCAGSAGED